jgi:UDP-galactose transporter
MRYARSVPGQSDWNPQTGVIVQEFIKLVTCGFLLGGNIVEVWQSRPELLKTSVPAMLYLVQNNLQYIGVSHLDSSTYAVLYQMKILTTALLSTVLLKKVITCNQWVALLSLTAGVAIVTLAQMGVHKGEDRAASYLYGVGVVVLACFTSGAAGVYFEMILKGSTVSLWARNFQLAVYSIFIGIGGLFLSGEFSTVVEKGFFYGYTWITWLPLANNAFGGLLIAAVIKYADNILKNFSTSLSIIMTAVLSTHVFGTTISHEFSLGVAFVVYAVFLYGNIIGIVPFLKKSAA